MNPPVAHSDLLIALRYDLNTGLFFWRSDRGNHVRLGDVAGRVNPHRGYRYISIAKRLYLAHRLAWFYVHGAWPRKGLDLDHIDGNRDNNRLSNLREATRSQNLRNSRCHKDNASGVKGVSWDRARNKWSARIYDGQKTRHLGRFEKIDEASAVFRASEIALSGSFAPLSNPR